MITSKWSRSAATCLAICLLSIVGCRTTQSPGTQIDDSWITTKVNSKFAASSEVKMTNISVQTDEGVVTLSGRVEDERAHREALKLARNTEGVVSVQDQIKVGAVD